MGRWLVADGCCRGLTGGRDLVLAVVIVVVVVPSMVFVVGFAEFLLEGGKVSHQFRVVGSYLASFFLGSACFLFGQAKFSQGFFKPFKLGHEVLHSVVQGLDIWATVGSRTSRGDNLVEFSTSVASGA